MKHLFLVIATVFCATAFAQMDPAVELIPIDKPVSGVVEIQARTQGEILEVKFLKNAEELGTAELKGEYWVYRWDTTQGGDAEYQIVAVVFHKQGRKLSPAITVSVDNTPPISTIQPFLQVSRDQVIFQVQAADSLSGIKQVDFYIDDQIVGIGKDEGSPSVYKYTWEVFPESKGSHQLQVEVADNAGNLKKLLQKIELDRTTPEVQVISPTSQKIMAGEVICEIKANDPAGIDEVKCEIDGIPQAKPEVVDGDGTWRISWIPPRDGRFTVKIHVFDKFRNKAEATVDVEVDVTAPQVRWVVPAQGPLYIRNPLYLEIEVYDLSGLKYVLLNDSQKPIPWVQEKGKWSMQWQPQVEKKYELVVESADSLGNVGKSEKLEVVYDKTPPQGSWNSPEIANGWSRLPLVVRVHGEDKASGIDRVDFFIDEQKRSSTKQQQGNWQIQLEALANGRHSLRATLFDRAGNETSLPEITLQIDALAPSLSVAPVEGTIFSKHAHLYVTSQDEGSGVAKVQFLCDGTLLQEFPWTGQKQAFQISLDAVSEGEHKLKTVVFDAAGNHTDSEYMQILVDRTAPKVVSQPIVEEEGVVTLAFSIEDAFSGVDIGAKPVVYLQMGDDKYPFEIVEFSKDKCLARFAIAEHPVNGGDIYIEKLRDRAGHEIGKTRLVQFTVEREPFSPWPLVPVKEPHPVLAYDKKKITNPTGGEWIIGKPGDKVFCVESGRVVEVSYSSLNHPGFIRIQRFYSDTVWGYHNIVPTKESRKQWAVGDTVREGDILGTLATVSDQQQSFLFIELISWKERWIAAASPLEYLVPQGKVTVEREELSSHIARSQKTGSSWHAGPPRVIDTEKFLSLRFSEWEQRDLLTIGYLLLSLVAAFVIWMVSRAERRV